MCVFDTGEFFCFVFCCGLEVFYACDVVFCHFMFFVMFVFFSLGGGTLFVWLIFFSWCLFCCGFGFCGVLFWVEFLRPIAGMLNASAVIIVILLEVIVFFFNS